MRHLHSQTHKHTNTQTNNSPNPFPKRGSKDSQLFSRFQVTKIKTQILGNFLLAHLSPTQDIEEGADGAVHSPLLVHSLLFLSSLSLSLHPHLCICFILLYFALFCFILLYFALPCFTLFAFHLATTQRNSKQASEFFGASILL